jgi:hypothetical protein
MNDLTIMITVTILLASFLAYVMYKCGRHLEWLSERNIYKPHEEKLLLIISFFAPFSFMIFIQASVGLI